MIQEQILPIQEWDPEKLKEGLNGGKVLDAANLSLKSRAAFLNPN